MAQDIAEEILWIASRPGTSFRRWGSCLPASADGRSLSWPVFVAAEHVNVADMLVFPSGACMSLALSSAHSTDPGWSLIPGGVGSASLGDDQPPRPARPAWISVVNECRTRYEVVKQCLVTIKSRTGGVCGEARGGAESERASGFMCSRRGAPPRHISHRYSPLHTLYSA